MPKNVCEKVEVDTFDPNCHYYPRVLNAQVRLKTPSLAASEARTCGQGAVVSMCFWERGRASSGWLFVLCVFVAPVCGLSVIVPLCVLLMPSHSRSSVCSSPSQIHSMVMYFLSMGNKRIVNRYCHLHPKVDPEELTKILTYQPRHFAWAGADLFHVTTEEGVCHNSHSSRYSERIHLPSLSSSSLCLLYLGVLLSFRS